MRLVKMAVQSFELEMFRGASDWPATTPPDFIVYESNERMAPTEVDPVIRFLDQIGYRLYGIDKRLFIGSVSPYCMAAPVRMANDMLALHWSSQLRVESRLRIRTSNERNPSR